MRISYKWLKEYIDTDLPAEALSEILTNIGLEVEHLETFQSVKGGLAGLVIGEVLECAKHPNADRLSVTKVNVGQGDALQIVCGAPNVSAGQKVIVAPVGTTVYPLEGEPFKINKSKIRSEVSEGMICAEDEIGLGKSHEGILVLPDSAPVGKSVSEFFKIEDDFVFEIGLTPNRADAASHLGVARDIAAYLGKEIRMPEFKLPVKSIDKPVEVEVQDFTACPRYSGVTIRNVEVKASPEWLQNKLKAVGLKPVNNIVDISNFICHALGQPMHAFDADQIKGKKVIVRKAKPGEKFLTLDEVERILSKDDLMICDTEKGMCIAGVFGGKNSGVYADTKNIFLESAYFNAVSVRKTAKYLGLKTDASFRYERGADPEITLLALQYASALILEIAGGEIASDWIDIYPEKINRATLTLNYKNADRLIGKAIEPQRIKSILQGLGIKILSESIGQIQLEVPAAKVDVTREVDIIEEILRIYGFNNIEMPVQLRSSLSFSNKPDDDDLRDTISNTLIALGFHEIVSNSLTKSAYHTFLNTEEAVHIQNPLSNELDVMRQTLMFSGLEAIHFNQNRKVSDLKFFEFGEIYRKDNGTYKEETRLALWVTGNKHAEHWSSKSEKVNFYTLKAYAGLLLKKLGLNDLDMRMSADALLVESLSFNKGEKSYLQIGKLHAKVQKYMDIQAEIYYAEFNWSLILKKRGSGATVTKEITKFPSVRRDLSMLIDKEVNFEQLRKIALQTERNLLKEINIFDVYEGDKLPEGKKSYALSFILLDEERTLSDKQIDQVMDKLIKNFETQVSAEIRKA